MHQPSPMWECPAELHNQSRGAGWSLPSFLPIDWLFFSQPLYPQGALWSHGFFLPLLMGTEELGASGCAAPLSSTAGNYPCGSCILHQCCCCCCFLLRVSATWSHGRVRDRNSVPGRKGRREKVDMKKHKLKKSTVKGRHAYIYSVICVAAPRGEVSTSSPCCCLLLLQLLAHLSEGQEQGHFLLGQEESWCTELLAGSLSRLQTEHSKSAELALSPGRGNLTTALHLQSIIPGFSEIHPVWQFQTPELHKGVSSLHSDLCVNGITYWIIAAYLFPNRITMKKKKVLEHYCFISENILKPITLSSHSHSALTENGWAWASLLKVLFPWV